MYFLLHRISNIECIYLAVRFVLLDTSDSCTSIHKTDSGLVPYSVTNILLSSKSQDFSSASGNVN
jgi:hypothetical protein